MFPKQITCVETTLLQHNAGAPYGNQLKGYNNLRPWTS
jgi:hypothetical protein